MEQMAPSCLRALEGGWVGAGLWPIRTACQPHAREGASFPQSWGYLEGRESAGLCLCPAPIADPGYPVSQTGKIRGRTYSKFSQEVPHSIMANTVHLQKCDPPPSLPSFVTLAHPKHHLRSSERQVVSEGPVFLRPGCLGQLGQLLPCRENECRCVLMCAYVCVETRFDLWSCGPRAFT